MAQFTWATPTQIKNCLDPSLAQDAATKNYVDTTIGQGGTYGNANVAVYLPTYTGNIANVLMVTSRENVTLVGANTTVTFDVLTSAIQFQTANATAATTVNFRGNSTTTLNTMLAVGQSVTVTYVMNTGATGYVVSTVQVDGTTQTVKYPNGVPPAAIASATNSFTYTIIKTAATPTYTVLGTQTGYA
jgi:hypothetical protein